MRLADVNYEKPIHLVLADLISSFCIKQGIIISKFTKRFNAYKYKLIGVVRAKTLNKSGTIYESFYSYFKYMCGYPNATFLSKFMCSIEPKMLAKFVSEVNVLAKTVLSKFKDISAWSLLVDLGNIVGYPHSEDRAKKDNDVYEWLVTKQLSVHKEFTKSKIKSIMVKLLGRTEYTDRGQSFESWLFARQNWINDGASKYSTMLVDGVKLRTKLGLALSFSNKKLLQICSLKYILRDGFRAFVKSDEKGLKLRNIINVPVGYYLIQKYLLDRVVSNQPYRLPLFGPLLGSEEKIERIQKAFDFGDNIPLDFEAFDHNIVEEMWDALHEYLLENTTDDYQEKTRDMIACYRYIDVYDTDGKNVGKWNKGLPSGLYGTSFFGTLFNLVYQEWLTERSKGKYLALLGQGDDSVVHRPFVLSVQPDLKEIADIVAQCGAIVNLQKNWYTYGITEFLKMVITKSEVYQYAARAYGSLLWAYPDFRNNDIQNKLQALASLWKEFFDRLGRYDEDLMVTDIHAAVLSRLRWSRNMIKLWLHTSPVLGGFGLTPVLFTHRFKYNTRPVKKIRKNNLYPRYVFSDSEIISVSVNKVSLFDLVDTQKHLNKTLYQITGDKYPSFKQYIEYMRYVNGLDNIYDLHGVNMKSKDGVLVRVFGYSDIYMLQLLGKFEFKGILKTFLNNYNDFLLIRIDRNFAFRSRQCWK